MLLADNRVASGVGGSGSAYPGGVQGTTGYSPAGAGGDAGGGGIWSGANAAFENCTIYHNSAVAGAGGWSGTKAPEGQNKGGGLAQSVGSARILDCTWAENTGGTGANITVLSNAVVQLANTILYQPGATANVSGPIIDLGQNLASDDSPQFTATGGRMTLDPRLSALGDYGGPTQTLALAPDSPARDRGNDALAPATDQRGVLRPVGVASDIGAFEYSELPVEITAQPQSQTVLAGTNATLRVSATGTAPLAYPWQKNAIDLVGATTGTLTLTNVQVADAGKYRVSVSNLLGSVWSAEAVLTVLSSIEYLTNLATVSVMAGAGTSGYAEGAGRSAQFNYPNGGFVDASGNIYIADFLNHRIRKITPEGTVSTVAGDGTAGWVDGLGSQARFRNPDGIVADAEGNLFIAGNGNHVIRRVNALGWVETVAGTGVAGLADGAGRLAQFSSPSGIGMDAEGALYVADGGNHLVRRIVVFRPVEITVQPQSQTVTAGATATLSVVATGTVPLSYQWRKDGVNVSGAPAPVLTLTNVTGADAGTYTVQVSNGVGSVLSVGAVLLTVSLPPEMKLSVRLIGHEIVLSWDDPAATLDEADSVSGPWKSGVGDSSSPRALAGCRMAPERRGKWSPNHPPPPGTIVLGVGVTGRGARRLARVRLMSVIPPGQERQRSDRVPMRRFAGATAIG